MTDVVIPKREGMVACGVFQQGGKFYAIQLPEETLRTVMGIAALHKGDAPIKVHSKIEFDEFLGPPPVPTLSVVK